MELFINGLSNTDLGFHLNPLFQIESPQVKAYYVDIPYGNGSLDLTEALTGSPTYENRVIRFTFEKLRPKDTWLSSYHDLVKKYHGKKVELKMPHDNDYHFVGRIQIGQYVRGDYLSVPCEAICEPYRIKNTLTVKTFTSTVTESTINLFNAQGKVVPTINTNAEVTIKQGANSFAISAGTHTLPIILNEGENELKLTGNATVSFTYQERML